MDRAYASDDKNCNRNQFESGRRVHEPRAVRNAAQVHQSNASDDPDDHRYAHWHNELRRQQADRHIRQGGRDAAT
jgi:hypothetical protein